MREWNEYPKAVGMQAPTCERCWHAIATWQGGPLDRYVCDKCKPLDERFGSA